MKYFVTGATGFVGGAVTLRLREEGRAVSALVRDEERAGALRDLGVTLVRGDLGDPNRLAAAFAGHEVVVHAAAVTDPRASERVLGWVNAAGTANAVAAGRHARVRRFVHIGCADVTMHNGPRMNWNEDQGLTTAPLDAHAVSKLEAEEGVIGAGDDVFETTALRPARLWGPGDHTTLPHLCHEALTEGGLALFGRGDNLVATTYVDHLVDAVLLAAERPEAAGAVYHVTDDDLTLASDFYGALSRAVGLPPVRYAGSYKVAYARAWARERLGRGGLTPREVVERGQSTSFDVGRARADLGYAPRFTQAEGMARLAAWVEAQGGAAAVAALRRPPPGDDAVEAQVRAARA